MTEQERENRDLQGRVEALGECLRESHAAEGRLGARVADLEGRLTESVAAMLEARKRAEASERHVVEFAKERDEAWRLRKDDQAYAKRLDQSNANIYAEWNKASLRAEAAEARVRRLEALVVDGVLLRLEAKREAEGA